MLDARDIWLIQSMCEFHRLETKNPYDHIRLFLSILDNIRADGATRDASRLRFFHFTLKGEAKKWLERLSLIHATSWEQLSSHFLNKFFPPERTTFNRSQILRFRQDKDKPIRDAWRCFKDLLHKTPHHRIKKWLLVQLFYDNMILVDKEKFSQFVKFKFALLHEDEGWDRIKEFVQYQEDSWDDPLSHGYVSLASELRKPTMDDRLKRAHQQLSYLTALLAENPLKMHISSAIFVNNDIPPWGNYIKEGGEEDLHWVFRSKFEDDMANFMMEKTYHLNGLREILDQRKTNMHKQFSQKQEKKDEDEKLLNIFKQIHINLPFLEAMIHMPKGSKVLKDLLSHKEKMEKADSLVKLSEECSVVIQKDLLQKEGDPGSFTLTCLIGPLAVKNALADLGSSINLMPYSLFRKLGISELKPTKMSI
ncbi:reverse transcriptase domain-containing protein [Tanacetum coccineum]